MTQNEPLCAISGHVREVFDFASGNSLFRVATAGPVFPRLQMEATDQLPINESATVAFRFSDPAGNFVGTPVRFFADAGRWSVVEKSSGVPLQADATGYYQAALGAELALVARSHPARANKRP